MGAHEPNPNGGFLNTRSTCRVCEGAIEPVLSFGDQYVSNFLTPGEPDGVCAPLELVLCTTCQLLQLKHTVPAEAMYRNYWYCSGTNRTMREALADIANTAETLAHLTPSEAVLDIGCNDGTLLASYRTEGVVRIGFDPAENMVPLARKVANQIVNGFFSAEGYRSHVNPAWPRPRIVTSIAMFYDLEDPNAFVADVRKVMHPNGVWIVQMSYLPLMLKHNELGNVCHEHLEYYSLRSFDYLLERHDMEIVDAEINDVNGGSIRTYIRRKNADPLAFGDATYARLARERVRILRNDEKELGLERKDPYLDFAFRVKRSKDDVVKFITEQVNHGKIVYVYGASTKGNTVLQYFGLDSRLVTAAAERNPDKWGKVTVGTHIPIISEEDARKANPDYFLVLPWHFIDEFQARERDYLSQGGRFILPTPYFSLR